LHLIRCWLLIFSLLTGQVLFASTLFEDETPIEIELIGPVQTLIEQRKHPKPLPFSLRAGDRDYAITARARGKSRLRVCEFPPIRIDFQGEITEGDLFAGQGKLKLVTQCRDQQSGDMNALEEYMAYRIFSLLSEAAYRVRLLRITYTDPGKGIDDDLRHRWGFAIEPTAQLAERVGGIDVDVRGVALKQLDPDQAALVYVFQYLIGNTDWSFVTGDGDEWCCHNGKLIGVGDKIYYVPYDFDLAGLVDASYAKPDPSFRLRSVRKRKYRGFCTDRETLASAIRRVTARKAEMYQLFREIPGMTDKARKKAETYLTQFFDKAENEKKLLHSFEKQCID
jgi:hypothetical protein